jgi:exodeoxyribonuclease-3
VRLVTWNVNSIRARVGTVERWLHAHQPDIVCLQETKCRDDDFPREAIESLGYEAAHFGVDHWNGVAIASRVGLTDVRNGFPGPQRPPYDEARLISATCANVRVHSVYVPNGRELDDPHYLYKLVWLERLRAVLLAEHAGTTPTILAGDLNVAPTDQDIYDPSRWRRRTHASPPERAAITALLDLGLHDVVRELHPDVPAFSWWSHRPGMFAADRGLRIDLVLVSEPLRSRVVGAFVDRDARAAAVASDHAPVVIEFDP